MSLFFSLPNVLMKVPAKGFIIAGPYVWSKRYGPYRKRLFELVGKLDFMVKPSFDERLTLISSSFSMELFRWPVALKASLRSSPFLLITVLVIVDPWNMGKSTMDRRSGLGDAIILTPYLEKKVFSWTKSECRRGMRICDLKNGNIV